MKRLILTLVLISSLIFSSAVFAYEEELFCDEIFIEPESLKLNTSKSLPGTFRQTLEAPNSKLELKRGAVSLFADSKKELNDYMTEDYKSNTGVTLNPGGRLSLTGGVEITHQNPDASINSKNMYLTPNFRLSDDISLTFSNKFDNDSRIYKNELGIQFTPKAFSSGSFGITAGTVFDEKDVKSQSLKFSTDLFLF